jgi:hypothetical protein
MTGEAKIGITTETENEQVRSSIGAVGVAETANIDMSQVEPFFPEVERQATFEVIAEAMDMARAVGDEHVPITKEQIDIEALSFVSDPDVKACLDEIKTTGQDFHIGVVPAEAFSQEAVEAMVASLADVEKRYNPDKLNIDLEIGDTGLGDGLSPTMPDGRLAFAIYLDGPGLYEHKVRTGQPLCGDLEKLYAKNPEGLRYVTRGNILKGVFNALQLEKQGKLNKRDTWREQTLAINTSSHNGYGETFSIRDRSGKEVVLGEEYLGGIQPLGVTIEK